MKKKLIIIFLIGIILILSGFLHMCIINKQNSNNKTNSKNTSIYQNQKICLDNTCFQSAKIENNQLTINIFQQEKHNEIDYLIKITLLDKNNKKLDEINYIFDILNDKITSLSIKLDNNTKKKLYSYKIKRIKEV